MSARDAILAIQQRVEIDLNGLLVEEPDLSPEEVELKFAGYTNEAVWESVLTLANYIDELRG
jgi:hypothetical protein